MTLISSLVADARVLLLGARRRKGEEQASYDAAVKELYRNLRTIGVTKFVHLLFEDVEDHLSTFSHDRTIELCLLYKLVEALSQVVAIHNIFVVGQESASMHQLLFLGLPVLSLVADPTDRTASDLPTHFPNFAVLHHSDLFNGVRLPHAVDGFLSCNRNLLGAFRLFAEQVGAILFTSISRRFLPNDTK